MIWRSEAVFCKRAIESAEQDEQNIMQRFHEDQKSLGFFSELRFCQWLEDAKIFTGKETVDFFPWNIKIKDVSMSKDMQDWLRANLGVAAKMFYTKIVMR